jgi:hypothetical protein
MKKILSFLIVTFLLLALAGSCFADSAPRQDGPALLRQQADSLHAERPGAAAVAAARSGYGRSGYSSRPSAGSRIIAGMILAGIGALVSALFGGKKKAAGQEPPPVAAENKFICRNCGKTCSGWYQTCPNCGAVGRMEKTKASEAPRPADRAGADGEPPLDRELPPEEIARTMSDTLAQLLSAALQFQTDSGLQGYLQRNRDLPEEKDRICLKALLTQGGPETLRERIRAVLALRSRG